MKKLLIAAAFALAACSGGAEPEVETADPEVTIDNAYIIPPFAGRDVAGGFFVIRNDGAPTRLVAASSPIAETVEIHTHLEVDGVMQMRQIDGLDLPTGSEIEFRPGSYHLMMFGASVAEDATEAPVTLTYENGQSETITMRIGE